MEISDKRFNAKHTIMRSQLLYNDKRNSFLENIKILNLYALKSHILKANIGLFGIVECFKCTNSIVGYFNTNKQKYLKENSWK